jgi:ubiquinone/menaquinone biosynthesis C-methylase UbiE
MDQSERLRTFDRFYEHVHQNIVRQVIRPKPESKALDAGCGAGGMTVLLAGALERGVVVAMDTNPQHLATTREQTDGIGASHRVQFLVGDVEKLQFLGGDFDFIWCSRVIHHHLPNPQPALSEMYRVLKPGGRLFLRENSNADLAVSIPALRLDAEVCSRCRLANARWFQSKFRSRRPAAEEWLRRMEQAGFDNVRVETMSFDAPHPRHQLAYIQTWLKGILEDHASPEHGNLLEAKDVAFMRETIAELERYLTQSDAALEALDIQIANTNPIFIGTK